MEINRNFWIGNKIVKPALRLLLTLFAILCGTTISGASIQEPHAGAVFEKTCVVFEGETPFSAEFVAPKRTVKEQYRELSEKAIAKTPTGDANPTIMRNGKDIFRVHKPGSGHGDKVTQNVMNGPPGNKVFPGSRDVNVRKSHVKKLQKALEGKGGYQLRLRNGNIVE